MDNHDFQRYLVQPQLLTDLPLADLQQLAITYPYSPNLRVLLLLKTHLEGHPDEGAYLNRAAAAAFDRAFMYDLLRDVTRMKAETEHEETLELKSLDDLTLAGTQIPVEPVAEEVLAYTYEDLVPTREENPETIDIDKGSGISDRVLEVIAAARTFPGVDVSTWAVKAADFCLALPEWSVKLEDGATLQPQPEPITAFTPLRPSPTKAPLSERLHSIRRIQADKLADEQEGVRRIARRSLVAQEATASETLAQLLVRQGQYQHAIKMYRRLELLYPEKKAIFASLIKDLKEKL